MEEKQMMDEFEEKLVNQKKPTQKTRRG